MMNLNKIVRDKKNQALINTDEESYEMYRNEMKKYKELVVSKKELQSLKYEVNELKNLVKVLLESKNG